MANRAKHTHVVSSAQPSLPAQPAESVQSAQSDRPHGFVANASTMPEIFTAEDQQRLRKVRSAQRQAQVFTALAIVCAIVGCAIIGYPYVLQFIDHQRQARLAAEVVNQVDGWPYPKAKEAFAAARAYNKRLAEGGQGDIGEETDPFTTNAGQSTINDASDSASARDATYMGLLNASNDEEIDAAFAEAGRRGARAMLVASDPFFNSRVAHFVDAAARDFKAPPRSTCASDPPPAPTETISMVGTRTV